MAKTYRVTVADSTGQQTTTETATAAHVAITRALMRANAGRPRPMKLAEAVQVYITRTS